MPLVERASLLEEYRAVRRMTEALCEPLEPEDFVVQSMPDASPIKWHLAHTTWFFETFLLERDVADYRRDFPEYNFLFNSYYNAVGERIARNRRGMLSRPTIGQVQHYRATIDARMEDWLGSADEATLERVGPVVTLGLNHEQQHQELIVTDLKHHLWSNPLRPAYRDKAAVLTEGVSSEMGWFDVEAGLPSIGFEGDGFSFDNESPRHPEYVAAFRLGERVITNSEYQAFMDDGGYAKPEFWLSDGWFTVQAQKWTAPLYWERGQDGQWWQFTFEGMQPVDPGAPVTHVSYFEADAYARWAGCRLATEAEWETVAAHQPMLGNFLESGRMHPEGTPLRSGLRQLYGDVWEWTRSQYVAYPGYRAVPGALGEYNGKFMCNQFVLRGGSCATPGSHIRPTYRNFFPPDARWQFSGIRLASDV